MTDPTTPTTGEPGQGLVITAAKKLVIEALRATFTAAYPNTNLANLHISMEYPYLEEQYPGIWVLFSLRLINAHGLTPNIYTNTEIYTMWRFEGTVSLNIVALTSKERDLIADGFMEAFAFASSFPAASVFYTTLTSSDLINMTPQSDIITPGGQTESFGVPWDENRYAYSDRYSFEVIGEVRSRPVPGAVFTNLSQIQAYSTLNNAQGAPNNAIGNDGNGVWQ